MSTSSESTPAFSPDCSPTSLDGAPGTLYGIGVGPGAPDLITLRAVAVLQSVSVILAAASPKNDDSLALTIASPHLPPACEVVRLDFPMTRDRTVLEAAWKRNARLTGHILRQGRNAAFLTLGDPMTYSTFGYLMRTVRDLEPDLPVEIVPGITSYQAAAAESRTVLCEGEESLLLLAGINGRERLQHLLGEADSSVILKTYRNMPEIREALHEAGKDEQCIFVSRLGLDGEVIARGSGAFPEKPHYLSLILTPPAR